MAHRGPLHLHSNRLVLPHRHHPILRRPPQRPRPRRHLHRHHCHHRHHLRLLGMASALETLCGQAYGAKQYHMLGIYMQRSWVVLFFSSILLVPLFLFATPILEFTGQSMEVAELSGVVALWLIPMHLSFGFQFTLVRFLQCQLKTAVIAWVSGVVLALHVFVSWLFVYKLRVGIVGTAITLDFSWWVSVLGLFGFVVCGGCPHSWTGFSNQAFVGLWEFFKLSVASGVMLLLENFYFRVLIIVAGKMQNAEVALDALSICVTILAWESMIPLGFFAATGVRVANELGAGNAEGAKFASIVCVFTSLLVGILFWVLILAIPDKLAMIFTSTTSVITMVEQLSVLLSFTVLLNCIQPVLSGVAVGSGWQVLVAFVNVGSYYIVGVPLGLVMGWFLDFGIEGIWCGMISGTVVQTLILTFITVRCKWEKQVQKARVHTNNEVATNRLLAS
ncbi:protein DETOXIFICATION 27-like isoform X2 [Rhododendron vialii]|uniref:protein DETOXIFICATION 27-like isoform X2 n=1 Tax=Rhododendron vialii TaxID=182163 RepID=UPI0026605512|nr:protein DETOXIFICATION 27-like isoform X2 [Rhododendron vialii]